MKNKISLILLTVIMFAFIDVSDIGASEVLEQEVCYDQIHWYYFSLADTSSKAEIEKKIINTTYRTNFNQIKSIPKNAKITSVSSTVTEITKDDIKRLFDMYIVSEKQVDKINGEYHHIHDDEYIDLSTNVSSTDNVDKKIREQYKKISIEKKQNLRNNYIDGVFVAQIKPSGVVITFTVTGNEISAVITRNYGGVNSLQNITPYTYFNGEKDESVYFISAKAKVVIKYCYTAKFTCEQVSSLIPSGKDNLNCKKSERKREQRVSYVIAQDGVEIWPAACSYMNAETLSFEEIKDLNESNIFSFKKVGLKYKLYYNFASKKEEDSGSYGVCTTKCLEEKLNNNKRDVWELTITVNNDKYKKILGYNKNEIKFNCKKGETVNERWCYPPNYYINEDGNINILRGENKFSDNKKIYNDFPILKGEVNIVKVDSTIMDEKIIWEGEDNNCKFFNNGNSSDFKYIWRTISLDKPFVNKEGDSRTSLDDQWNPGEIKKIIIDRKNIYNSDHLMYKIELTPEIIKNIRNYNKEKNYSYKDAPLNNGISDYLRENKLILSGKCKMEKAVRANNKCGIN